MLAPQSEYRQASRPPWPHLGIRAAIALLITTLLITTSIVIALVVSGVASQTLGLAIQSERAVAPADDEQVSLEVVPVRSATAPQATSGMAGSERRARPWLGIYARDVVLPDDYAPALACQGAMIVDVLIGGPADEAGLHVTRFESGGHSSRISEPGDVIIAIDRLGVTSVDDLEYNPDLLGKRVGDTVRLRVVRKTEVLEIPIRLTTRDDSQAWARQVHLLARTAHLV